MSESNTTTAVLSKTNRLVSLLTALSVVTTLIIGTYVATWPHGEVERQTRRITLNTPKLIASLDNEISALNRKLLGLQRRLTQQSNLHTKKLLLSSIEHQKSLLLQKNSQRNALQK